MPSHQTHDLIALSVAPVLTLASTAYLDTTHALLFGGAVIISNYYLSPDTDTRSILDKRWSLLKYIWYPYRCLFHHRSFWTHSGPISASIRLFYLFILLSPLIFYYDLFYITHYKTELILIYIATCISDTLHTGVDYGSTFLYYLWKNTKRLVTFT